MSNDHGDESQRPDHQSEVKKNSTETSVSRRATVRTLLGLGALIGTSQALPTKWTRPVVESVMLPAHAQTSPTDGDDNNGNGGNGTPSGITGSFSGQGTVMMASAGNWLLDTIVPTAYAQSGEGATDTVCINITDGTAEVLARIHGGQGSGGVVASGNGPADGSQISLTSSSGGNFSNATLTINSITGTAPSRILNVTLAYSSTGSGGQDWSGTFNVSEISSPCTAPPPSE